MQYTLQINKKCGRYILPHKLFFSGNYILFMPFAKPKARKSFTISPTINGKKPTFSKYITPKLDPLFDKLKNNPKSPGI